MAATAPGFATVVREMMDKFRAQQLREPTNTQSAARKKLVLLDNLSPYRKPKDGPAAPIESAALDDFLKSMRYLLADSVKAIRAAALRTLRYFLNDTAMLRAMLDCKLQIFIVKSLERSIGAKQEREQARSVEYAKQELERIQAMKLVRRMIEIDPVIMPHNIVVSLVATAEYADDYFARCSLECLCELAVHNAHMVALSGGVRLFLRALTLKKYDDLVEPLTLTLVNMLNHHDTRQFVHPDFDLGMILSPFTDTPLAGDTDVVRRRVAAKRAFLTFVRTWPGLVCLASSPQVGLSSLVQSLFLEEPEARDMVLLTFYELFNLPMPSAGMTNFIEAVRSGQNSSLESKELSRKNVEKRFHLMDGYLSVLLLSVKKAGLIEALVELAMGEDRALSVATAVLLGEVLHIANRILPPSECAKLQALPLLVSSACAFKDQYVDPALRSRANTLLSNLHEFARMKKLTAEFYDFHKQLILQNTNKTRKLLGIETNRTGTIQSDVKTKVESNMNDVTFQNMLRDSKVLSERSFEKWDWEIISEILEGPFSDTDKMRECIKGTKFARRILQFMRPTSEFAKLPYDKLNPNANVKYVRTSCRLLEALLQTDEGTGFLCENPLLEEIADLCKLEATAVDTAGTTRKLDRQLLATTLLREYFTMLGVLSSCKRGREVMQRYNLFHAQYPLIASGRDDLTRLIVSGLDYNLEGHPRTLLAKSLCQPCVKVVRYYATAHIRVLLRAGTCGFKDWGTDLLLTQLKDEDKEVAELALNILNESCDDEDILRELIEKKPDIESLGVTGRDILLRFMSLPSGFKFLSERDWVLPNMAIWHDKGNVEYVTKVEAATAEALHPFLFRGGSEEVEKGTDAPVLPPHFYGELCKTDLGCNILRQSGHFDEFERDVRSGPDADIARRKAALWAVGHVGASSGGFEFVRRADLVPVLTRLAQTETVLSVRGTAYHALGLISLSDEGRAALRDLEWETLGANGICVPADTSQLLAVPAYHYVGMWPDSALNDPTQLVDDMFGPNIPATRKRRAEKADEDVDDDDDLLEIENVPARILTLIGKLTSHITADTASQELKRLKRSDKTTTHFNSVELFCVVLQMLEAYKFKTPARRFVWELFDAVAFCEAESMERLDAAAYLKPIVIDPRTG